MKNNAQGIFRAAAVILLLVGLGFGFAPVSPEGGVGSCGSVLGGGGTDELAEAMDNVDIAFGDEPRSASCEQGFATRRPLTFLALGLGVVALIASFVVPTQEQNIANANFDKMHELSDEEFERQLKDYREGRRDKLPGQD